MEVINGKIFVNLDGPDGNSFSILSLIDSLFRQTGRSREEYNQVADRLMNSDYKNLIYYLIDEFGCFITLKGFEDDRLKVTDNLTNTESSTWF